MNFKKRPSFFYLLSFIEGAAVMAAELLGAKMLAPYFGSSLYVWATVLAVTLGGLALGYFCGGILSYKKKNTNVLFYVMIIAAIFVVLMPFIAKTIMLLTGFHSLIPSVIISTIVFLLPPVFMMGMVSPLIIVNITTTAEQSGKIAGTVYAVSTVGGIVSTFTTGFYIIPNFGLTIPCIITGILLGIIPLLVVLKKNIFVSIFFPLICAWSFYKAFTFDVQPGVNIAYMSEGLLGQLVVADIPQYDNAKKIKGMQRILYVNRISQTMLGGENDSAKHFGYVDMIIGRVKCSSGKKSALVCGLGGGSLASELIKNNFDVDACELDERIVFVAKKYFSLSEKINVNVDDARHFIRNSQKKYDLIVLDMFKGEENPAHCFTSEAFEGIENILNKGGMLVINGNGFITGSRGRGMGSIVCTLINEGFNISMASSGEEEAYRNLVLFAIPNRADWKPRKFDNDCSGLKYADLWHLELDDPHLLCDDKPELDKLNLEAYSTWRKSTINYFINETKEGRGIPIFK